MGRKGKKHRKMGGKRHFEPVKRAELRFPENPTNHSSPPARRRQKIAPSAIHPHLSTLLARTSIFRPHSLTPSASYPCHSSTSAPFLPTQIRRCQTPPSTIQSCSHSRTPPSFTSPYCAASPHTTPHPLSPPLWMRHHNSFNPSFGKTPKRHSLDIIPTT